MPIPVFANGLQHVALHVENENLVAQCVGDVNALRRGIDGDSSRTLEISFAAFQAADRPLKFSAGLEDEDLAGLRIGHIDVVFGIHGDALRCDQPVVVISVARDEFVLLLSKVEDVDSGRSRIGHDDAAAGILHDFVGTDQDMKVGSARHDVDEFGPEAALNLHFGLRPETALKGEPPSTLQQQLGNFYGLRLGGLPDCSRHRSQQQRHGANQCSLPARLTENRFQKNLNHRVIPMKNDEYEAAGWPVMLNPCCSLK